MADRPTPEEIAVRIVRFLLTAYQQPHAYRKARARIADAIRVERADADRRVAEAERELAGMRKHYDAAAPERNLLALLDMYHQRAVDAERERDECLADAVRFRLSQDAREPREARVAVLERAWAAVHEALGIKPDGLAGILGTIEDLKEGIERGEHRK